MTKFCPDCNTIKPISEFGFKRPNKPMCRCKICQRVVQRQRWHANNYKLGRQNWVKKNQEKDKSYKKKYRDANKDKTLAYLTNRRKTDVEFKIKGNLRHRIWLSLRGGQKSNTTVKLLGCSIQHLTNYLEKLFQPGMTWENYGVKGWHIDHIRPCASFDLTDSEQQKQCFHYANLQPLWAIDNLEKHAFYEEGLL